MYFIDCLFVLKKFNLYVNWVFNFVEMWNLLIINLVIIGGGLILKVYFF